MHLKNFFTSIESLNFSTKVHHTDKIISVGSCFASEIGNKLKELDFDISVNPFGTIFNPISIFNLIYTSINNTPINRSQIVFTNGLYYHYQWHSSIYGTSEGELLSKIEQVKSRVRTYIKTCKHIFLTFGTSIIHEYNSDIVSNCHKQNRNLFHKRFLTLEELKEAFINFNEQIQATNPNIKVIVTTSPVRHIKEGLIDNNQSKALLNVFNKHLSDTYSHIEYFPSYEIIMDVLRDYRFFKTDLIHPNSQAVDEIWTYFQSQVVHPDSYTYITKMGKYNLMDKHILMFPKSENGKRFTEKKEKLYQEIQGLK